MSVYAPPAPEHTAPVGFVGMQRNIGTQILLSIVSLGLYGLYWAYMSHEDIRWHTGEGVAASSGWIWLFAQPVSLFLLPIEIQQMYEADG